MGWLPNWVTGYDEENATRAAVADAELRRINQANRDRGLYDDSTWKQYEADYGLQEAFGVVEQRKSIDAAFTESLAENRDAIKNFFNGAVFQLLKSVPFVVWLAVGVWLFFYFGGLNLLKRKLALR